MIGEQNIQDRGGLKWRRGLVKRFFFGAFVFALALFGALGGNAQRAEAYNPNCVPIIVDNLYNLYEYDANGEVVYNPDGTPKQSLGAFDSTYGYAGVAWVPGPVQYKKKVVGTPGYVEGRYPQNRDQYVVAITTYYVKYNIKFTCSDHPPFSVYAIERDPDTGQEYRIGGYTSAMGRIGPLHTPKRGGQSVSATVIVSFGPDDEYTFASRPACVERDRVANYNGWDFYGFAASWLPVGSTLDESNFAMDGMYSPIQIAGSACSGSTPPPSISPDPKTNPESDPDPNASPDEPPTTPPPTIIIGDGGGGGSGGCTVNCGGGGDGGSGTPTDGTPSNPLPLSVNCSVTPTRTSTGNTLSWQANSVGGNGTVTFTWLDDLSGNTAKNVTTGPYASSVNRSARVQAVSGSQTVVSSVCSATVAPQIPTSLVGTPHCQAVTSGALTITAYHDTNTLSWGSVAGASNYKVYVSLSASGSYSLLATVSTNTFVHLLRSGLNTVVSSPWIGDLSYKVTAVDASGIESDLSSSVTISDTSGGASGCGATAPAITLPSFDFSLTNGGKLTIARGSSGNIAINGILSSGATPLNVALTVNNPNANVTTSIAKTPIKPTETTSLTVNVGASATIGTASSIVVTGTYRSGGRCTTRRTVSTDWLDCTLTSGEVLPSLQMFTATAYSSQSLSVNYFGQIANRFCGPGGYVSSPASVSFPSVGSTATFTCNVGIVRTTSVPLDIVAAPAPDLVGANVVANPTAVTLGQSTRITGDIANIGNASVPGTFNSYFRAQKKNTVTSTVITDLGDISAAIPVTGLGAFSSGVNAIRSVALDWTPPSTTAANEAYEITLCADRTAGNGPGTITESDETNNCSLTVARVTVTQLVPNTLTVKANLDGTPIAIPITGTYSGTTEFTRTSVNPMSGTLTAGDVPGTKFIGWTVGASACTSSTGATCTFDVSGSASKTVTAQYSLAGINLQVSAGSSGPWSSTVTVDYGADVFVRWSGSNVSATCQAAASPALSSWGAVTNVSTSPASKQAFGSAVSIWPTSEGYSLTLICTIQGKSEVITSAPATINIRPTILAAAVPVDCSKVDINWSTVPVASTYNVYYSTTVGTPKVYSLLAGGVTGGTYRHTGASPSTTYYYRIDAVNTKGTASATAQASTGACVAPTVSVTLTAVPATGSATLSSRLTATITGTATGNATYTFYCDDDGIHAPQVVTVNASSASPAANCTYAIPGEVRNPRVTVTRQGASDAATTQVRVDLPPPAAASITASTGVCGGTATGGRIQLKWDTITGASKYNIYESSDGITYPGTPSKVINAITGATTYNDTISSLPFGATRYYKIQSESSGGVKSAMSTAKSATASSRCGDPVANLRIFAIDTSELTSAPRIVDYNSPVDLTWTSVDTESCKGVGFGTGCDNTTVKGCSNSASPTRSAALTSDTPFNLICTARYADADAQVTNLAPKYVYVRPPQPVITANPAGNCVNTINISWPSVPLATGYKLYRALSPSGAQTAVTYTSGTPNSASDNGLAENTTYYYFLNSERVVPGIGTLSSPVVTTTSATTCAHPPNTVNVIALTTDTSTELVVPVRDAASTLFNTKYTTTSTNLISLPTLMPAQPVLANYVFSGYRSCDNQARIDAAQDGFCSVSANNGQTKTVYLLYRPRPARDLTLEVRPGGSSENWSSTYAIVNYNGAVDLRWSTATLKNCVASVDISAGVTGWVGNKTLDAGGNQALTIEAGVLANATSAGRYIFTLSCQDLYDATPITKSVTAYVRPRQPTLSGTPALISPAVAAPNCARIPTTWTASALHNGYDLSVSTNNGASYALLSSFAAASSNYIHTPLAGGQRYIYRLIAKNNIGGQNLYSDPSILDTTMPLCPGGTFDYTISANNVSVFAGQSVATTLGRTRNPSSTTIQPTTFLITSITNPSGTVVTAAGSGAATLTHAAAQMTVTITSNQAVNPNTASDVSISTNAATPTGTYVVAVRSQSTSPVSLADKTAAFTVTVNSSTPDCSATSLSAAPSSVSWGDPNAPTLTWRSSGADVCVGSSNNAAAPFSTANATNGSIIRGGLTANTTFGLVCTKTATGGTCTPPPVSVCVRPGNGIVDVTNNGTTGALTVEWSTFPTATSYGIYRSTNPTATPSAATFLSTTTALTFADSSLLSATDYYYTILAANACGTNAIQATGRTVDPKPNLISMSPTTAGPLRVGSAITFDAIVRNIGSADVNAAIRVASSFVVKKNGVAVANLGNSNAPSLGLLRTTPQTFTSPSWTIPDTAPFTVDVCADATNLVNEINEYDNCATSALFTPVIPFAYTLAGQNVGVVVAGPTVTADINKTLVSGTTEAVDVKVVSVKRLATGAINIPTSPAASVCDTTSKLCITIQNPSNLAPTSKAIASVTAASGTNTGDYDVTVRGTSATTGIVADAVFRVTASAQPVVTCTLIASPTTVSYNSSASLTWSSTNATVCTGQSTVASTPFDTRNNTSGTTVVNNITQNTTFTLNCSDVVSARSCPAQTVTPCVLPGAAILLATTPSATGGTGRVRLDWNLAPLATGYDLYRSTSASFVPGPANIVTPATPFTATSQSYTDSGLTAGTLYYYTLVAKNACGNSSSSDHANASQAAGQPNFVVSTLPSSLSSVPGQTTSITGVIKNTGLSGISSGVVTNTFYVQKGGVWIALSPSVPASAGLDPNQTKTVIYPNWVVDSTVTAIRLCADDPNAYTETNESDNCGQSAFAPSSTFNYSLTTPNVVVEVGGSIPASITKTLVNGTPEAVTLRIISIRNANTGVTNTAATPGASLCDITGAVCLAINDPSNAAPTATVSATATASAAATAGLNYDVTIRGTSTSGVVITSLLRITTINPVCIAPSAPIVVATTPDSSGGEGKVSLTWSSVPGVSIYDVYRGTFSGFTPDPSNDIVGSPFATGQSITDSGMTPGSIYYYVVVARNACGQAQAASNARASQNGLKPNFFVSLAPSTGGNTVIGRATSIVAQVKNNGDIGISSGKVRNTFYVLRSGSWQSLGFVDSSSGFEPGETQTITYPSWTIESTVTAIRLCADDPGVYDEKSEADNCNQTPITPEVTACANPPDQPSNLSLFNSGSFINASWTSARTPGPSYDAQFDIYRDTVPGFVPSAGNLVASNFTSQTYADSIPGTDMTYYYKVRAKMRLAPTCYTDSAERSIYIPGPSGSFSISCVADPSEGDSPFTTVVRPQIDSGTPSAGDTYAFQCIAAPGTPPADSEYSSTFTKTCSFIATSQLNNRFIQCYVKRGVPGNPVYTAQTTVTIHGAAPAASLSLSVWNPAKAGADKWDTKADLPGIAANFPAETAYPTADLKYTILNMPTPVSCVPTGEPLWAAYTPPGGWRNGLDWTFTTGRIHSTVYTPLTITCTDVNGVTVNASVNVRVTGLPAPTDNYTVNVGKKIEVVFSKGSVVQKTLPVVVTPQNGFSSSVRLSVVPSAGLPTVAEDKEGQRGIYKFKNGDLQSVLPTQALNTELQLALPREVLDGEYPLRIKVSGTSSTGVAIDQYVDYTIKVIHINPDFKEI